MRGQVFFLPTKADHEHSTRVVACLAFFGTPLVIGPSLDQLSSDAGLLLIRRCDQSIGLTRANRAPGFVPNSVRLRITILRNLRPHAIPEGKSPGASGIENRIAQETRTAARRGQIPFSRPLACWRAVRQPGRAAPRRA